MKRRDATDGNSGSEAARWFVGADGDRDRNADTELARWLVAQPANERAMERVELAVELGRRLAADPGSPLHRESQLAAQLRPRRVPLKRVLAWGGALAAMLLVALFVMRDEVAPPLERVVIQAARAVAVDAPGTAVAVLPSGVVVDASAVAVLPFAGPGDGALATGLERDVVEALRTVPGLYVIADAAVRPYAGTELSAAEIGGLLGARGLVDGSVELVDGRVRGHARLRDSATGATLWETEVDRPVEELRSIRLDIAEHVATAMFDAGARADGEPSSAKPLQQ